MGKEYIKSLYYHPAYLTYMQIEPGSLAPLALARGLFTTAPLRNPYLQSTPCRMLGWMNQKLEFRLPGEISITSDMQMTPTLLAESEQELKSLLAKVKKEGGKVGLKLNILKTKTMACGPITSWEIDGEIIERLSDFTFLQL